MRKVLTKYGLITLILMLIFNLFITTTTGQALAIDLTQKLLYQSYTQQDIKCLTEAVYFEARGEPVVGHKAVIEVVLNRLDNPKFPNTICNVIRQNHQFSYRLYPRVVKDTKLYDQIKAEVENHLLKVGVLKLDQTRVIAKCSDHYDGKKSKAKWIKSMHNPQAIGRHVFYCNTDDKA